MASIDSQGKLTPALEQAIKKADTKTVLEDLYLPYKPKRRTKSQIAIEAGLEPLADSIFTDRNCDPRAMALTYLNDEHGINSSEQALEGARHILMEHIAEDAELIHELRERVWNHGIIQSKVVLKKEQEAIKYKDYFDYQEAIKQIPSHRALALFRGRNEDLLNLTLLPAVDTEVAHQANVCTVAEYMNLSSKSSPAETWLWETALFTWKVKIYTRIDLDLKMRLRELAEQEAIRVFSNNLRDLLLAAPAGQKVTLGLDPGIRTGVKVAVIDATGKLLTTTTIYPHPPKRQWQESINMLAEFIKQYKVELISLGNGTGSRETDQLLHDLFTHYPDLRINKLMVSEAGASVYSASQLAANEFPELDVSLRGAVSIARRIQDPLAELVKIEPKAIGVGQYQHDVNQVQLNRGLNAVVEDCVNAVGVDINTASASLLQHISGLSSTVGQNIITYRNEHGGFKNRQQLKKVPRLGDKAFEQAAGFLRISNAENPLEGSVVHPEAYPLVESILADNKKSLKEVLGKAEFLKKLHPEKYTSEEFGLPTVNDIILELEKPGRDPRPEFKSANFKAGIESISDLKEGMTLEGVVTNVANFGAFVDVGVHQDGLVHISHLADQFVKNPRDIVKTGDMVQVTVVDVDLARQRIALSMRKTVDTVVTAKARNSKVMKPKKQQQNTGALANALSKAMNR